MNKVVEFLNANPVQYLATVCLLYTSPDVIVCADLFLAVVEHLAKTAIVDINDKDFFALEFLRHRQSLSLIHI